MGEPLGHKAYGSIGHLPNSRLGPGDHSVSPGQAKICCEKERDSHDRIIVQEKLDGSCCAVARVDGHILALGRAGWLADSSPYEQHRMFAHWVRENEARFLDVLHNGERLVGEWLALAHGTRYELRHDPFVVFDLMAGKERMLFDELDDRIEQRFPRPFLISEQHPIPAAEALAIAQHHNHHGAIDPIEGVVYRVERKNRVDFLAKYVRPDKVDGSFLSFVSGNPAVWNWTAWEPKGDTPVSCAS